MTCSDPAAPVEQKMPVFSIYLLRDASMTTVEALKFDLSELELRSAPMLTDFGFQSYYLTSHTIELGIPLNTFFKEKEIFQKPEGTPFVVVAEGERIYLGSFQALLPFAYYVAPCIRGDLENDWFSNRTRFRIAMAAVMGDKSQFKDVRYDERVIEALEKTGKLNMSDDYITEEGDVIYSP
ncbi:hypothetical protein ACFL6L_05035 [candidate division KSB1 bacterium]